MSRNHISILVFTIIYVSMIVLIRLTNDQYLPCVAVNISGLMDFVLTPHPLIISPNLTWRPPAEFKPDLDKYLIYRSELKPALLRPLIVEHCDRYVPVIVLITSAINNQHRRNAIRNTWATRNKNFAHYFVIGSRSNDTELMKKIRQESKEHRDLVQFDLEDNYRNLTGKVISALKWSKKCRRAMFVIKTYDDYYLDLPKISDKLRTLTNINSNCPITHSIFGLNLYYPQFSRNQSNYHYVPPEVYDGDVFPQYFIGGFTIYGKKTIRELIKTALKSFPALFIEDVFLTGFVAERVRLNRIRLNPKIVNFNCSDKKEENLANKLVIGDKCKDMDLMYIHFVKQRLRNTI